eukprot:TRINITY_DN10121_c0_g1_i1.p1 TRINITY_DN10121_c0_g1~~TRINITY_DN10121_c0_g1_i1.p1  ORF type:complete len:756 (+),score=215.63 TRINITY_DN10121_c0_g1_i1:127-2268(+)
MHATQQVQGAIETIPNNDTMFSELQHHPRATQRLRRNDPLPQTLRRDAQQAERAQAAQNSFAQVDPRGRDLARFLSQAMVPAPQGHFNQSLLRLAKETAGHAARDEVPEGTMITTATQTDYRESETQTDPWTPDYVVRPGSAPEVLTLATLSHGHGLPAGLAEVEMIERARARRAWEATLPPADDPYRAVERAKAMELQELEELQQREVEIQRVQDERLDLLQRLIVELEEGKQQQRDERLSKHHHQRQIEKNRRMAKVEQQAVKEIRKLAKQRQNVEGTLQRRDVVAEYSNPASNEFAPQATRGVQVHDLASSRYRINSRHLDTYSGLLNLEASLPRGVSSTRVSRPVQTGRMTGKKAATKRRLQATLRKLDETLNMTRTGTLPVLPPITCVERIEQPVERPPTPTVDEPTPEARQRRRAVVLLQSILRGRAVQNRMYEGREQRRDLIDEVRSTHALQQAEQEVKAQEAAAVQEQREDEALQARRRQFVNWAAADIQGNQIGSTLDFLSKELVRLQEEHRIHAFAMMAERERRMREAEEAGRRQVEEQHRQRNDEVFRQVMQTHATTIDSFLEDIVLQAQDRVADDQARAYVREQAAKINAAATEAHESGYDGTELGAHAIASELVTSFLLPEVEKETQREQVQRDQRKFLQSAHQTIAASTAHVEVERKRLRSARSARSSRVASAIRSTRAQSQAIPEAAEAEDDVFQAHD